MLLVPWISMTGSEMMGNFLMKPNQKDLVFMKELLEAGKVVPVIDWRYTLSETAEALRYLEDTPKEKLSSRCEDAAPMEKLWTKANGNSSTFRPEECKPTERVRRSKKIIRLPHCRYRGHRLQIALSASPSFWWTHRHRIVDACQGFCRLRCRHRYGR